MSGLPPDLDLISQWIDKGSRVLDLGCGDGRLLAHLSQKLGVKSYGIEIDHDQVVQCIRRHVNVIQTDLDAGLSEFRSNSFDHVIMHQTIQAIRSPDKLLLEMLRVGREGIVAFPNFGHWASRVQLGILGHMPVTRAMPNQWFSTPNIRLCTIKDFERLCVDLRITVLDRIIVNGNHQSTLRVRLLPKFLGEIAIYRLKRS